MLYTAPAELIAPVTDEWPDLSTVNEATFQARERGTVTVPRIPRRVHMGLLGSEQQGS